MTQTTLTAQVGPTSEVKHMALRVLMIELVLIAEPLLAVAVPAGEGVGDAPEEWVLAGVKEWAVAPGLRGVGVGTMGQPGTRGRKVQEATVL